MKAPLSPVAWVVAVSGSAGVGRAQMGYTADTLEALVAGSTVVVRATVAEVERGPVVDQRGPAKIVLNIVETLKGPAAKTFTFHRNLLGSYHVYEGWRRAGREGLWFFVPEADPRRLDAKGPGPDRPLVYWNVIRLGPAVAEEKGFVPGPPPIFTMDLTVLDRPDDILKAARAAAREGSAEITGIDVPRGIMQRSGRSGDANSLGVPVDRRLEALARRLIMAPGEILSSDGLPPPKDDAERKFRENWQRGMEASLRREGVTALRPFKSDANIALLRPLLDDPASWRRTRYEGDLTIDLGREYYVRKAAYEVLREWGVAVAKPVIDEPPPKPPGGATVR